MFFSIVALAVAAVGQTVFANPLAIRTTNVGSSFPKSELNVELVAPHSNVTFGHNGLHPDATQATFPADLLLCTDSLCGACTAF
ncbi:hypothetical protein NUW54_g1732 [Trametes sanguinea]|uniref:Uncharacterized protein n=1 Tax=Trametes sanguinea TaxID=158606 RepID=A0ACC1Q7X6_9APHY|nr:hypothetical protein NUW54_g1732 [Trametes sanguinea]